MKKILVFLVVLIGLYGGFWTYNSFKFKDQVKVYLDSQNVTYKEIAVSGFPFSYKANVLDPQEKLEDETFSSQLIFDDFHFSKRVISGKITVKARPYVSFSFKNKPGEPEFPFSHVGFTGKVTIKGLPDLNSLENIFSDLVQAIMNPNANKFSRKIFIENFVFFHGENEPLISWDSFLFSLQRSSAVGGIYRSEIDVDFKNFVGDKKLWDLAVSPLKEASKDAAIDKSILDWIGEVAKLYLSEKKDLSLHLGFTFPEGFSPSQFIINPQSIPEKLLDAEVVTHYSSMGSKADTEIQFTSVIIDENTKQISYDVHYAGHYSKHYWELANKALDKATNIKAETDEFKFLVTWAKTLQHFHPSWENISFDYGFLTDVDRKTLTPKSAALKQLKLKIDDMSIAVGLADESIDFHHVGTLGDEKIPITIHQYPRFFGGIANFFVEWIKESKMSGLKLHQEMMLPKDDLPKNLVTLIKEISDEPESSSPDTTITILVGEAGPKKIGTLPLINALKKFYQFYEDSFVIPESKPEKKQEPKPVSKPEKKLELKTGTQ